MATSNFDMYSAVVFCGLTAALSTLLVHKGYLWILMYITLSGAIYLAAKNHVLGDVGIMDVLRAILYLAPVAVILFVIHANVVR
ncbi:MAG: hypothetical protein ACFCUG_10245 [Thiotrichales bacterium]